MRLASRRLSSWSSTFHLVLLISISSFLGVVLTIVEAQNNGGTGRPAQRGVIEYPAGFRGDDDRYGTLSTTEKNGEVKPPPRIHPVYEAREFLVEHNKVRQKLGEPLLVWDKTLAHYARRFAGQRAATCDMIHSEGPYGENIYWGASYFKHTAAAAVRAWAGETNDYNPQTNTCNPSKLCGHYKQMVWKTSTKLGCARVKCNNGGVYIICSYDPPGNYIGESPFDTPGNGQGPPQSSQTPSTPVQTPPTQTKPAQTPPAPTQSAQTPPAPTKPAQTPPAQTKPAQTPPSPAQKVPTSLSTPS